RREPRCGVGEHDGQLERLCRTDRAPPRGGSRREHGEPGGGGHRRREGDAAVALGLGTLVRPTGAIPPGAFLELSLSSRYSMARMVDHKQASPGLTGGARRSLALACLVLFTCGLVYRDAVLAAPTRRRAPVVGRRGVATKQGVVDFAALAAHEAR